MKKTGRKSHWLSAGFIFSKLTVYLRFVYNEKKKFILYMFHSVDGDCSMQSDRSALPYPRYTTFG